MIFIPNGVVSQSTITNITADDKRRLELKFSISYNDDHNKAMAILREMLNDEPRVINEPDKPLVAICEHGRKRYNPYHACMDTDRCLLGDTIQISQRGKGTL